MSAQQSDNVSYGIIALITGIMKYFELIPLRIPFFSTEWITTTAHAVIAGALCASGGWIAKKITEIGYNSLTEYFRGRKAKKQLKRKS